MAWPPPALATNRSNATPQQDAHPQDHNAIAQAMNDLVAELGPDPSGGAANLTTKLATLDNGVQSLDARTRAQANPNHIEGVDQINGMRGFGISAAKATVTTNAAGEFAIYFPAGLFAAAPIVVANTASSSPNAIVSSVSTSATTYLGHVINSHDLTPIANSPISIHYIAIGVKP